MKHDNFEELLKLALAECGEKDAETFLNIDASDFVITPEMDKRFKELLAQARKEYDESKQKD